MRSFQLLTVFILTLFIFTINHALPVEYETENGFLETAKSEKQNVEDYLSLNGVQYHPDLWSSTTLEDDLPMKDDEEHDLLETDYLRRIKRAPKTFGGKKDTSSGSARAAFRKAKDQNGIPRSKQPSAQYSVPDKHNPNQNLRQYDFVNAYGKKISIRKDIPIRYPDGGGQGPHYNAGPSGGKLKQHHNIRN